MTNIFVGNLSFKTTQDELLAAFSQYGNVERVSIVTDRETGQPRGFAFVEMTEKRDAETAISQLNGADLNPSRRAVAPVAAVVVTAAIAALVAAAGAIAAVVPAGN